MRDKIVKRVINDFKSRSELGIKKYGVTLDRDDLTSLEWLNHLREELMDAVLYVTKLTDEINRDYNRGYADGLKRGYEIKKIKDDCEHS